MAGGTGCRRGTRYECHARLDSHGSGQRRSPGFRRAGETEAGDAEGEVARNGRTREAKAGLAGQRTDSAGGSNPPAESVR